MFLSIVVPCYKERDNLFQLNEEIKREMSVIRQDYELILVDDGSPDDTFIRIKELAKVNPNIRFLSFSRNFGKEAAMFAGLRAAEGDSIVIMDGDLQHPPSMIRQMIKEYDKGYDQVVMKRDRRGEKFLRKYVTKFYYRTMNHVMDVRLADGEGDFRLISRQVRDVILELNETNRFSKGIFEWVGFDKKVIPFGNVERTGGQSSFNMIRLFDYAMDGILNYNTKPLRICLYLGTIPMVFSMIYISIMLIQVMTTGIKEPGYFTIMAGILFLGSVQLLSLGIIGEYIGRIYNETKHRPHYVIKETNDE